jgi:hypothetical protein
VTTSPQRSAPPHRPRRAPRSPTRSGDPRGRAVLPRSLHAAAALRNKPGPARDDERVRCAALRHLRDAPESSEVDVNLRVRPAFCFARYRPIPRAPQSPRFVSERRLTPSRRPVPDPVNNVRPTPLTSPKPATRFGRIWRLARPGWDTVVVEPSARDFQSGQPPPEEQSPPIGAERVRDGLKEAVDSGERGRDLAETLCVACVDLLVVDGATLSVVQDGTVGGSVGSSNALSRELDELQFTCGEGPGVDAGTADIPVLVADLENGSVERWPAFAPAAIQRGVRAMFALPVSMASVHLGVLDLYRSRPGELDAAALAGGLLAAELAVLPLLDLMGDLNAAVAEPASSAYRELRLMTRVEVYQATGMLIAELNVGPAEALVRLRGYAYAHDRTVNDVAWDIVERRLRLEGDESWHTDERDETS